MQQVDEFKEFVKKHPGLKEEVSSGKRKWQDIYEEWTFYQSPENWSRYSQSKDNIPNDNVPKENRASEEVPDFMKTVYGYIKKINPDSMTKTIGNLQKIMGLLSGFSQGTKQGSKVTGDPLFDKKFDEWY